MGKGKIKRKNSVGFFKEYKEEIFQTLCLIFISIMLIIGASEMSKEYKQTKENYNNQLIEINTKLDKIQLELDNITERISELEL